MKKVSIKIVILFIILSAFFTSCKVTVNPKPDKEKELYEAAKKMPLTLLAEEDGVITLSRTDLVTNFKYTKNNDKPVFISSEDPVDIVVSKGDKVCFYGEGTNNKQDQNFNIQDQNFNINCSEYCSVYGNVMSLLTVEYQTATEITLSFAFHQLFRDNSHLKNHPINKLVLPAEILHSYCYSRMFFGCSSFTIAPELPATRLADSCYHSMFEGCAFIKAPKLPATTLSNSCYAHMFYDCISLKEAPELPAINLASSCYTGMFNGCLSLVTAPELPATTLASNCYNSMFSGCVSLKTAPELPATELATSCYANMFYKCSSLIEAPELPAKTLKNVCYSKMFFECENINSIKCLATNISASQCTDSWLKGVSSTGEFITLSRTPWTRDESGIPTGWTRVNTQ